MTHRVNYALINITFDFGIFRWAIAAWECVSTVYMCVRVCVWKVPFYVPCRWLRLQPYKVYVHISHMFREFHLQHPPRRRLPPPIPLHLCNAVRNILTVCVRVIWSDLWSVLMLLARCYWWLIYCDAIYSAEWDVKPQTSVNYARSINFISMWIVWQTVTRSLYGLPFVTHKNTHTQQRSQMHWRASGHKDKPAWWRHFNNELEKRNDFFPV